MLDELRALAVLAKVIEVGSFRGAARALGLAPSVISHHVRELESRLAVPLLYRSTRKLSLTPAGARLAEEARVMVDAAERGLDGVRSRGARQRGTLRVTFPAFLAESSACADLAAFVAAHPEVQIAASFADSTRDLLSEGLDLAVRIAVLGDSEHRTRRLGAMHRVLVAAPSLVSKGPAPTASDVERLPFVHLASRPVTVRLTDQRQPLILRFVPSFSVDSAIAIRSLVLAGAGVATLPDVMTREHIAAGRLVELLPGWHVDPMPVHAIWPRAAVRATLTQRFVDFMAPRLADLFTPPAPARAAGPAGRKRATRRQAASELAREAGGTRARTRS